MNLNLHISSKKMFDKNVFEQMSLNKLVSSIFVIFPYIYYVSFFPISQICKAPLVASGRDKVV